MFISSFNAEDRSPYSNFWFEPVGARTASGMRVSADSAMQLSAVFRAVGLLSGHMALLPIRFYKRDTRQKIDHPLLKLLNRRPNGQQNAFEWREMLQAHLELRGNAYCEIIANARGEITDLIPRHPDRVQIVQHASGDYHYTIMGIDGGMRTVNRGSVWHVKGLSSNGIIGLSVIEYARESFGLGLAAQSYGANFFANDAKPTGGWIEYPGSYKDKTQREQIRESLQDAQTGKNRGKLMLLDHGMKYHEVGLTNRDSQFLESRQHSVTDIARWFGVPPHKIGDLSRSTNNNIEQQSLEYVQDALLPRASRWESSIGADLLFDDEEIDVEFDFGAFLRGDAGARSSYYHNGILDGWLTRNEARGMEGREALDGLDEPMRPLNMTEEDDAEDAEADAEAAEDPAQEAAETDDDDDEEKKRKIDNEKRLNALLANNAQRMARRFAKSGQLDALLIAESMAVTIQTAEQFCAENEHAHQRPELSAMLMNL